MNSTLKSFARLRAQHILYADRAIIVVNKPHGLICQSDKSFQEVGVASMYFKVNHDTEHLEAYRTS